MSRIRTSSILAITLAVFGMAAVGEVHSQTQAASAPTAKEVRKAERKAAKAKSASELRVLEKNGYDPANGMNYPGNLENAESKNNGTGGAAHKSQ